MALDLEIWIDRKNKSFKHKSCTKEQNLFLYLLPNSAHSPNTLDGMTTIMLEKCWRHCSNQTDYEREAHLLFQRLLDAGHNPSNLSTLFTKSAQKIKKKVTRAGAIPKSAKYACVIKNHQRLFSHPTYYPKDTPRRSMQELFNKTCKPILRDFLNV